MNPETNNNMFTHGYNPPPPCPQDHQQTIEELREEVRWHEQRALDQRDAPTAARKPSPSPTRPAAAAAAAGAKKGPTGGPRSPPPKARPGSTGPAGSGPGRSAVAMPSRPGARAASPSAVGARAAAAAAAPPAPPTYAYSTESEHEEEEENEEEEEDLYDLSDGEEYAYGRRRQPPGGDPDESTGDVDMTLAHGGSHPPSRLPGPPAGFLGSPVRPAASLIPRSGPESGWTRDRDAAGFAPEVDLTSTYVLTARADQDSLRAEPQVSTRGAAADLSVGSQAAQGGRPTYGAPASARDRDLYFAAAAGAAPPSARRPQTADAGFDAPDPSAVAVRSRANNSIRDAWAPGAGGGAAAGTAAAAAALPSARYGDLRGSDLESTNPYLASFTAARGPDAAAPFADSSLHLLFGQHSAAATPASPQRPQQASTSRRDIPLAASAASPRVATVHASTVGRPPLQLQQHGAGGAPSSSVMPPGPSGLGRSGGSGALSDSAQGGIAQTTRHPDGKVRLRERNY